MIKLSEAAGALKKAENIQILCHQSPDGDTLGAATALRRALQLMGKHAQIGCSDEIGKKFMYLFAGLHVEKPFEIQYVVSVDIADLQLLGEPLLSEFGDRINLSIDHHPSNSLFAEKNYVDAKASATCEIIYEIVRLLGVPLDRSIAASLYTGISTDTGCFKYINVTPRTYRIAADLVETGIDAPEINHVMFDTKSRQRLELERMVLDGIQYNYDDRVAVIVVTREMMTTSGAAEDDIDGIASIPRKIEGVKIGVTFREKENGDWKVSLRTERPMNASEICAVFGGGGHAGAAGCTFVGIPLERAREQMVEAIGDYLKKQELA